MHFHIFELQPSKTSISSFKTFIIFISYHLELNDNIKTMKKKQFILCNLSF